MEISLENLYVDIGTLKAARAICQRGEKIVLTWCKGRGGAGEWVGGWFVS